MHKNAGRIIGEYSFMQKLSNIFDGGSSLFHSYPDMRILIYGSDFRVLQRIIVVLQTPSGPSRIASSGDGQ